MKISNTSQRLQQIIKEKNLKQIDILNKVKPLCEEYGVKMGSNDLSQYVQGKVEPSQRKLSILAKALNTNEVWLMGYNVPMEDKNEISINMNDYIIMSDYIYPFDKGEKVILKDLYQLLIAYNSFIDDIIKTFKNSNIDESEKGWIFDRCDVFVQHLEEMKKKKKKLNALSENEKSNILFDIKNYTSTMNQLQEMLKQNNLPKNIKEQLESLYNQAKVDKANKEALIQQTERKINVEW